MYREAGRVNEREMCVRVQMCVCVKEMGLGMGRTGKRPRAIRCVSKKMSACTKLGPDEYCFVCECVCVYVSVCVNG